MIKQDRPEPEVKIDVPNEFDEVYQRALSLRKEISYHNYLYYVKSDPVISDAEFDQLFNELKSLEKQYDFLKDPNSPTVNVGGTTVNSLKKIHLRASMKSLDKAYTSDEVSDFFIRSKDRCKDYSRDEFQKGYVVEPKFDGMSLLLKYRDGQLQFASTRGDGNTGNDVSHNARMIKSIPKTLTHEVKLMYVRGEVFIRKENFTKIVEKQLKDGIEPYKNARNLVSGSMQSLDSSIIGERFIEFIAYEIINIDQDDSIKISVYDRKNDGYKVYDLHTHSQCIALLSKLGFNTYSTGLVFPQLSDLYDHCIQDAFYQQLRQLPYEVDGFVIKLNSIKLQKELGQSIAFPNGSVAFKMPQTQYPTRLTGIEWGIGKTGALTPVALFDKVFIDGSHVSRASLHNVNEIKRMNLEIGCYILVEKAGGVIPYVCGRTNKVSKAVSEASNLQPIEIPTVCPVCGKPLELSDTGLLSCPNPQCAGIFQQQFIYACGKKGLDLKGFGDKLCVALTETMKVKVLSDLFNLKVQDFMDLGGITVKMAKQHIETIESKKIISLQKFIEILQIPQIGPSSAKILVDNLKSLDGIKTASKSQLLELPNCGPVVADSIYEFFHNEFNLEEIDRLLDHLTIKEFKGSDKLKGLTFCITGTLSQPRPQFEQIVQDNGGEITNSISKKLNYLLCGTDAGSKLEKANAAGVKIINEEDFLKLIE